MPQAIKTFIKFIVICFIIINAYKTQAQEIQNDSIVKQFKFYNQQTIREKIFVHTDREFYLAGEILWFKVYVVDATFHKPLDLNKVGYVEVLDKDNAVVVQAKVALKSGKGNGSFYLPLTSMSGNFIIRAYTNLMKNFAVEYYFEKEITIINSITGLNLSEIKKTPAKYDVQFFPEGGYYVNDLTSKVAFRAIDKQGKGIDFTGVIVDQYSDTVAYIKPVKFGIGNFKLTPSHDKVYHAIIKNSIGEQFNYPLPTSKSQGYTMSVIDTLENKIKVTVHMVPFIENFKLNLFIHTRHQVKFNRTLNLQNGKAEVIIEKNMLSDGISHFTTLTATGEPLCERLYFKYASPSVAVQAATDQKNYASRKRVQVSIGLQNINQKSIPTNLSLSVYKADSLNGNMDCNIATYLLLTADLVGAIEEPEYYFKNINSLEIDNLMLTHGWRRFKWENVREGKSSSIQFMPEFEGQLLKGLISSSIDGERAGNLTVYLSVPSKNFQFLQSKSNSAGELQFILKDLYGTANMVLQTNPYLDSMYTISLANPFDDRHFNKLLKDFEVSKIYEPQIKSRSMSMQIQNVYWLDKLNQKKLSSTSNTVFYSTHSKRYLMDDYTRFPTMEEVMREYIHEIKVRKRQGKFHYQVVDIDRNIILDEDPLVLLDGVPYFDTDEFITIDPLKVKQLDMIYKKYVFGSDIYNGIVSYRTYNGDLDGFPLQPKVQTIKYEGMQWPREFYSPAYDAQNYTSRKPDFRNLLYWSPDINTDKAGNALVNFYTSDEQGSYVGVLQGMDDNGNLVDTTFSFNVK